MILLPATIRHALRANDIARRAAERGGTAEPDPVPLVKFFNPLGPATWIATELDGDGDTLFGLADLGFGCPELGSFSLHELASVHLPFGMGIERDETFATPFRLSAWAKMAREAGSLLYAEALLARAERRPNPELPTDPVPPEERGDG